MNPTLSELTDKGAPVDAKRYSVGFCRTLISLWKCLRLNLKFKRKESTFQKAKVSIFIK